MHSYYTAITALVLIALAVLCVLIRENNRITREDKRLLYLTYVLIAVAALAEWCGVTLNGRVDMPSWLLPAVKYVDYTVTPIAALAFVEQMRVQNRWRSILRVLVGANALFQIVSVFTGWMLVIDGEGHYVHGPLYAIYLCVCVAIALLVVVEFFAYGKKFRRQNRASVYAIVLMVVAGFAMQQLLPSEPRTSYIALTMGAAMMFIHYAELSSVAMEDRLEEQQVKIETDALTGVSSRYAYNQALAAFEAEGGPPDDLVVYVVDINGLKQVNDNYGHEAGDELIIGAAQCIEAALGESGICYRTGGDEFVAIAHLSRDEAPRIASRMEDAASRWRGSETKKLALSVGYAEAADYEDISIQALMRAADASMYAAKAEYYQKIGNDRRRRIA